jgi:hypothetical protein
VWGFFYHAAPVKTFKGGGGIHVERRGGGWTRGAWRAADSCVSGAHVERKEEGGGGWT